MKLPSVRGSGRPGQQPSAGPPGGAILAYFRELLTGAIPLGRVFWRHMALDGTVLNLIAMVAGLALFGAGLPTPVALTVFFAPVPYNLLLLIGVWRSAGADASGWGGAARVVALAWFAAMFLL